MSVQVGSQEKVRAEERAALMKSLRVLLAENFTDRISRERILDDAHLSVAYIVDAPNRYRSLVQGPTEYRQP